MDLSRNVPNTVADGAIEGNGGVFGADMIDRGERASPTGYVQRITRRGIHSRFSFPSLAAAWRASATSGWSSGSAWRKASAKNS